MDEMQTLKSDIDWQEWMRLWNDDMNEAVRRAFAYEQWSRTFSEALSRIPDFAMMRCKLCGEEFQPTSVIDGRQVCPDCWEHIEKVAESVGHPATPEALQAALFGLAPSHSIWYGRPWQDHVKDRRCLP